jgi:hypothetical protein
MPKINSIPKCALVLDVKDRIDFGDLERHHLLVSRSSPLRDELRVVAPPRTGVATPGDSIDPESLRRVLRETRRCLS